MDYASSKVLTTQERLYRLRRVANLLDTKFSIFGFRFGIDSLIGLIPVAGDIVPALISLAIIIEARSMGVPSHILSRMVFNTALDFAVGSIPLVGDIFDVTWKANKRNVKLVEKYLGLT